MKSYDTILIGIILGLMLYSYFLPIIKEKMTDTEPIIKIDTQKCSRDCCKHTQWPAPYQKKIIDDHVGTNLMCNGGTGGGCVCMKNKEFEYLSERAGNGM